MLACGAGGYLAGIVLVTLIPETTLVGVIVVCMGSGSVGGGAMQVTANALTGRALMDYKVSGLKLRPLTFHRQGDRIT